MNGAQFDLTSRPEEMRFERKFLVEGDDRFEIEAMLRVLPQAVREIYPPRCINNIYFDYPSYYCFFSNVEGLGRRHKYRIRWYGEMLNESPGAELEIKRKTNMLGNKLRSKVSTFRTAEGIDVDSTLGALSQVSDADLRPGLKMLQCVLVNRYRRRYFQTADRKFRITLDTDLKYFPFTFGRANLEKPVKVNATIIEVKYAFSDDPMAHGLLNLIPYRITRISKYVRGVETLNMLGYC